MNGAAEGLLDARREPGAVRELCDRLTARGVRMVRLTHSDLYGRARSKQFPIECLPELMHGVAYSKASIVEGLDGYALEGGAFPADLGHPDLHAIPDLTTVRVLPWEPDTAWVLADLVEHDQPSPLCSRAAVRRAVDVLARLGVTAQVAHEPEFYLLRRTDSGVLPYSPHEGQSYTVGLSSDPDGSFGRIHRGLAALGLPVTAGGREYSPGQFEINLRHGDPLLSADVSFAFKEAVKELAVVEGLVANFMAKPFTEHAGSSQHLHVSLWRDAVNLGAASGMLAGESGAFVSGVARRARALAALAGPTVNSYTRLQPGGLAPLEASVGVDDRMRYLRVPAEGGNGSRMELRAGDASASPYLLAAGVILAGVAGMLDPQPVPDVPDPLPRTLTEAVAELEADEVLREGLGAELVDCLVALKRREAQRFAASVTDWEWQEYAIHA